MSRPDDEELAHNRWLRDVEAQERQAEALERIAESLARLVTLAEGDDGAGACPEPDCLLSNNHTGNCLRRPG